MREGRLHSTAHSQHRPLTLLARRPAWLLLQPQRHVFTHAPGKDNLCPETRSNISVPHKYRRACATHIITHA